MSMAKKSLVSAGLAASVVMVASVMKQRRAQIVSGKHQQRRQAALETLRESPLVMAVARWKRQREAARSIQSAWRGKICLRRPSTPTKIEKKEKADIATFSVVTCLSHSNDEAVVDKDRNDASASFDNSFSSDEDDDDTSVLVSDIVETKASSSPNKGNKALISVRYIFGLFVTFAIATTFLRVNNCALLHHNCSVFKIKTPFHFMREGRVIGNVGNAALNSKSEVVADGRRQKIVRTMLGPWEHVQS